MEEISLSFILLRKKPEMGGGDICEDYLFAPQIDISQREDVIFARGSHGQTKNNNKFFEWLEGLPEDHYEKI